MSKLCEGRVVIVTGAGRGIGREIARALSEAGARVVIAEIDQLTAADAEGGENSVQGLARETPQDHPARLIEKPADGSEKTVAAFAFVRRRRARGAFLIGRFGPAAEDP